MIKRHLEEECSHVQSALLIAPEIQMWGRKFLELNPANSNSMRGVAPFSTIHLRPVGSQVVPLQFQENLLECEILHPL